MYRHVVFDVDGTILDTEKAILESFKNILKTRYSMEVEDEDIKFILGIPGREVLKRMNLDRIDETMEIWIDSLPEYRKMIKIFDGVKELLDELSDLGINLGVVTSKTEKELYDDFSMFDLSRYFKIMVHAEKTERHKPNPEPLEYYIDKAGADKTEVIYIGDSIYDSQCAKSAGVDFGLAKWGSDNHSIAADFGFDSPKDLIKVIK